MEPTAAEKENFTFLLTQKQANSSDQEQQEFPLDARITSNLGGQIARTCHEIFFPKFKPKIIPDDACFFAFEKGLEVEGEKPDYVLALGQKQGKMKIPLIIFHENIPIERLDDSTPQLFEYAKKILEDDYDVNNQKFKFDHISIVLIFPIDLEFRIFTFKRPGKNQTLADVVKCTGQYHLFQDPTKEVDNKKVVNFFEAVLGDVGSQLQTLHLFDEKYLQKE